MLETNKAATSHRDFRIFDAFDQWQKENKAVKRLKKLMDESRNENAL